jgi:hypothetical protein
MAKRKTNDDDIRLEDVHTHEDKLRYSRMMRRRWGSIGPDEPPDAILDLERFPIEDPNRPWMHPEWAASVEHAERQRRRALRGK